MTFIVPAPEKLHDGILFLFEKSANKIIGH